jgi:subtilisin family serine protease
MVRVGAIWRTKLRPAVLALLAALPLICSESPAALAQSIMRSPNLNISSRMPSFDRAMPRIDPSIGARGVPGVMGDGMRIRPDCSAAYRDGSGNCSDQPVTSADRSGRKNRDKSGRGNATLEASLNSRAITNEILAEIDGAQSEAQVDAWARRHGLRRVESQSFPLIGATIGLFRITGGKTVDAASRELALDGARSVQLNFRYVLQDQDAALSEGDPAQYALAKLRLPQAHTLAHGANVTIAVIDSGIDLKHPEFSAATITPFDALGSKEGPHAHGTGVAGAIVSHGRLMGSAPAAKILAIRAFGVSGKGAESTSYVILKGLDFAAAHGAQIVNMSFAGPKDGLIERGLAALAARNIVMVAASGNAGPKSPPLYPAADANVVAVSATDALDKLFAASNRGSYVALAAPGVDIFLPAPDDKYQITSGTSFSAAYVSGLAALILERNPTLKPEEVRAILTKTARDLGPPGRDDQFGAGEADAFAAVSAVSVPSMPVAAVSAKPAAIDVPNAPDPAAPQGEATQAATMAANKPVASESQPVPGQNKPATP